MSAAPDDFLGRVVLGRYRIVHNLAKGGMGVIYLARSEGAAGFAKPVVVKRIITQYVDDDGVVQMFKREARIMSNMRHPGVVSVLDFGHEDGAYLMVLEYVHGYHAGRWRRFVQTRGDNFPTEFAVQIVICVLDALHYAHTLIGPDGKPLRIIHRDVSPSNVLIDVDGHVKLADFGIARATDLTSLTASTAMLGTPAYMAPEGDASVQADLYATGVVLYEMLTGHPPFEGATAQEIFRKHLQEPPDLAKLPAGRPREVTAWLLAKRPADRPANATVALGAVEGTTVPPKVVAAAAPGRPVPARRRFAPALLLAPVAVVAALAGGGAVLWAAGGGDSNATTPPPTATSAPPPSAMPGTGGGGAAASPSPAPSVQASSVARPSASVSAPAVSSPSPTPNPEQTVTPPPSIPTPTPSINAAPPPPTPTPTPTPPPPPTPTPTPRPPTPVPTPIPSPTPTPTPVPAALKILAVGCEPAAPSPGEPIYCNPTIQGPPVTYGWLASGADPSVGHNPTFSTQWATPGIRRVVLKVCAVAPNPGGCVNETQEIYVYQ